MTEKAEISRRRFGAHKRGRKAAGPDTIERMGERVAGRMVRACSRRCFCCRRFIGHVETFGRGCPGVRGCEEGRNPICHVDLVTGRGDSPIERLGRAAA